MAGRKYPPTGDVEVLAAGEQFTTNSAAAVSAGLTEADIRRLTDARTAAQTAFDAHTVAQQTARANRAAKDDAMDALVDILSEFNKRLQPLATIDDSIRSKLGIPVYDAVPTQAAAPGELPSVKIDPAMPLAHTIYFADADGRGKPDGVKAVEIYIKIGGDATAEVNDYRYLAQDTESPYIKEFTAADAGKQAHYLLCWINSSGARGAFQMASATVTSLLSNSRV